MLDKIERFSGFWRNLSNFADAEVELYGEKYKTVEHAYQAAKTSDPTMRAKIAKAATPGDAKRLGRQVALRDDWEEVKVATMRYLLWQKFSVSGPNRSRLLGSSPAELIEGNTWGDTFWGVCNGVGENWLGRLLMETRQQLFEQRLTS